MTTYTTITGREIKVSSNQSKKTFTIKTESGKYRTLQMSSQEFNSADRNWTGNDWQNFLKTDEYYKVN
jgi:hypothetical protein